MDDYSLLKEVIVVMGFVKYIILEEFWSEEDGYYYVWWDK